MSAAWTTVPLGEVIEHRKEFIIIDDLQTYRRPRVQLHAQGIVLRDAVLGAQIKTKKQQVAREGEFLVAEIDAKVGGFGIVPADLHGSIVSSHYFLYGHRTSQLDNRYLGWFVKTREFRQQIEAQGSTNYAAIRPDDVLGYKIPLPPLDRQKRIVARIEGLAASVAEAQRMRLQSSQETHALKNGYLRHLFSKLAKTASIEIGQLCDVRGGIQKSPDRAPGANPVRYITVAHVQRDRLDVTDKRYFEVSADELERWKLKSGDVLIIEGNGSADQIGRACLFRGEIHNCVHQNHVIRLRPNTEIMIPEYLNFFLNSPAGRDEVQSLSRTTSGLRTLSVGRIRSIKMPTPSVMEQRRFLEKASAQVASMEGIQALQAETSAELNAMIPAILDKAFKGDL
jgi:type I restriction enzyme S subunit